MPKLIRVFSIREGGHGMVVSEEIHNTTLVETISVHMYHKKKNKWTSHSYTRDEYNQLFKNGTLQEAPECKI